MTEFQLGDRVEYKGTGGEVILIGDDILVFPIRVLFDDGIEDTFTKEGRYTPQEEISLFKISSKQPEQLALI